MQVNFVHCSDWFIPVGNDAYDILGKHKLSACSYRDGEDWDEFKNKAISAGLQIQVFEITGKTSPASIIKGDLSTLKFSHELAAKPESLSAKTEPVAAKPETLAAKTDAVAAKDDGFFTVPEDDVPFPVIGDQK